MQRAQTTHSGHGAPRRPSSLCTDAAICFPIITPAIAHPTFGCIAAGTRQEDDGSVAVNEGTVVKYARGWPELELGFPRRDQSKRNPPPTARE